MAGRPKRRAKEAGLNPPQGDSVEPADNASKTEKLVAARAAQAAWYRSMSPRAVRAAGIDSEDARQLVEYMAFLGQPRELIAKWLDISTTTLETYYGQELLDGGKSMQALVALTMAEKAMMGDVSAGIFILKSRAGWRDKDTIVLQNEDTEALAPEARREVTRRILEYVDQIKRAAIPVLAEAEDADFKEVKE